MAKIESIADAFVEEWCHEDHDRDEFKASLIDLIADIHREYIIASISNEVCGKNLHSQYSSVIKEMKDIRRQLEQFKEESMETLRETKAPTRTTTARKTSSELGPFGSRAALEFATANNIDPNVVVGTGKDGKITKTDLNKVIKKDSSKISKSSSKTSASKDTKKYCNGHTTSGDPCKSTGKLNIKGKWYCSRHKSQAEVCENIEEDDQFSNYDDSSAKIDRFRDQSIKSLETVDDNDIKLNDLLDTDDKVDDDEVEDLDDEVEKDDIEDEYE